MPKVEDSSNAILYPDAGGVPMSSCRIFTLQKQGPNHFSTPWSPDSIYWSNSGSGETNGNNDGSAVQTMNLSFVLNPPEPAPVPTHHPTVEGHEPTAVPASPGGKNPSFTTPFPMPIDRSQHQAAGPSTLPKLATNRVYNAWYMHKHTTQANVEVPETLSKPLKDLIRAKFKAASIAEIDEWDSIAAAYTAIWVNAGRTYTDYAEVVLMMAKMKSENQPVPWPSSSWDLSDDERRQCILNYS